MGIQKVLVCGLLLAAWRAGVAEVSVRVQKAGTVKVLMLSDLHFDPFRDVGKAVRLAETPESGWEAILEEPASADAVAGAAGDAGSL